MLSFGHVLSLLSNTMNDHAPSGSHVRVEPIDFEDNLVVDRSGKLRSDRRLKDDAVAGI